MGDIFLLYAGIWGLLALYLYSLVKKEQHLQEEIDQLEDE